MLRIVRAVVLFSVVCAGCSSSGYAVRSVPRIASDNIGQPVSRLQDAFGPPRKVETSSTRQLYVWFLEQSPPGAPQGLHGCEMEVTVDPRSDRVLGYSLSNIGWAKCPEIERKIRIARL